MDWERQGKIPAPLRGGGESRRRSAVFAGTRPAVAHLLVSSMIVTSGGARSLMGGPQVPDPRLV